MIKGLLGGLLSGGVVAAAVLGAVSLMSAPPVPHEVASAPSVPIMPATEGSGTPSTGTGPAVVTGAATDSLEPATTTPDAVVTPETKAAETKAAEPAQTAEGAGSTPDAAVIAPPAGSEFDKPAVDAPAAAPASDASISIAPAPEAIAPEATEPAAPGIGGDTAPPPAQPDAAVLAKAPDAESAPAAPSGLDLPTEAKSAPVPEASSAQDAAPVPPLASEPAPAPAPQPIPDATPGPDQSLPEATNPDQGAIGDSAPEEPVDESLPDDPLPGEAMPDEPMPGDSMPGDAMPGESAPGQVGAGAAAGSVANPGFKRVLPPVLKGGVKSSDVAPSNLPPVISPDAPEPPQGVTAAPKPGFQRAVPGVKVNRLPTIQSAPEAEGQGAPDSAEVVPPSAAEAPAMIDAPIKPRAADVAELPLHRYAARLDNPANLPVLGVVVIELGDVAGGANMADLMALPVPVTLAINPMRKDGLEVAARARAHGFEVAMLVDSLPKDGTASDVEVSYQSISAGMPEAVAVMTSPENTLMTRRPVAQQVVTILKDEGLGLVNYARGLSPAREIARSEGLPQAEVSRVVDEPRGDVATILRTLEAEAFQAQQKGGAVVVLRSYPDSIAALSQFIAKVEAEKSTVGVKVGPVTAFLK